MNQVSLMGNVATDLELKKSQKTDKVYTQFRLAVSNYNRQEKTTHFIDIAAFGQQAQTLTKYLTKGSKLLVMGRLSSDSYEGQDGRIQYSTKVILEDFEFVGRKNKTREDEVLEA